MAQGKSKGKKKTKGRAGKTSPAAIISVSLGAIALALAFVLGGLALKSQPQASETGQNQEPPHTAAEGASSEDAQPSPDIAQPASEHAQPASETAPPKPNGPKAQPEAARSASGAGLGSQPSREEGLPRLPEITGFHAPKGSPPETQPKENASFARPVESKDGRSTAGNRKPAGKVLILVIDDAGYSIAQLKPFLDLPFPLTVAVLPDLPHSVEIAKAVKAAGKELILHQPMQPLGSQNPGPGALTLGMSQDEVEATIEANLQTVPGAQGFNNHMGSAATENPEMMLAAAAVAKNLGIYYLDSRTTSHSAIPLAARREGIRYWERDVFLDNTPDRVSIVKAVEDGKKRAARSRPAIMIGHVWSADLAQTLMDLYPQLIAEGYSLSTISRYMVEEGNDDDHDD